MTAGSPSGFHLSYGDLLAVAARVMGDETVDEQGRIVAPAKSTGEPRYRCERAVRRAVAALLGESQDWGWAKQDVDLTFVADGTGAQNVEGAAGDYWMPWWFRHEDQTGWELTGSTTGFVEIMPDSFIETMRQASEPSETGIPFYASFRQRDGRIMARFFPIPDAAYTVRITGRIWPSVPPGEDDVMPFGVEALDALERRCMYEGACERNLSSDRRQELERDYMAALARLRAADDAKKPRQAGRLAPTMRDPRGGGAMAHPPANTVTYNGAAF